MTSSRVSTFCRCQGGACLSSSVTKTEPRSPAEMLVLDPSLDEAELKAGFTLNRVRQTRETRRALWGRRSRSPRAGHPTQHHRAGTVTPRGRFSKEQLQPAVPWRGGSAARGSGHTRSSSGSCPGSCCCVGLVLIHTRGYTENISQASGREAAGTVPAVARVRALHMLQRGYSMHRGDRTMHRGEAAAWHGPAAARRTCSNSRSSCGTNPGFTQNQLQPHGDGGRAQDCADSRQQLLGTCVAAACGACSGQGRHLPE